MTDTAHHQRNAPSGQKLRNWVKERGLLLANIGLFLVFFGGMIFSGAADYSEDQLTHGQPAVSLLEYVGTSRFWFESFQNWQSEFLAVAVLVGASVYLREKGSPESKPVAEPHYETGA
jgi:hypothetical protein